MNKQVFNALKGVAALLDPAPVRFRPPNMPDYLGTQSDARYITKMSAKRARSRNTHRGKRGKAVTL